MSFRRFALSLDLPTGPQAVHPQYRNRSADDNADTLVAAADRPLYRAKAAGRGQWQLAPDR